jgi:hypothetical protein
MQKEKAWCFTNIEKQTWDYCDLPKCSNLIAITAFILVSLFKSVAI